MAYGDQNNLSLDSDEEGDGSDGEHDEPEPINNKGWFKLGGGGGNKRGLVTKSSNLILPFTNQKDQKLVFNSRKY